MEPKDIILLVCLVVGALLLIAIVAVILFFRSRFQKKNEIVNLEKERDYLQTLMSGKIAKNIARIELISRTNLLYGEVLKTAQTSSKPLLISLNGELKEEIESLNLRVKNKDFSGLKKDINIVKSHLNSTKTRVLSLEAEIDEIIKPEEETRTSALYVKEELREIRKLYAEHEKEVQLVAKVFKDLIDNVNEEFNKIDAYIERAEYTEANNSIREMDALFKELHVIFIDLPQCCVLITEVIPNKIIEVRRIYEDMEKQQFPLRHLKVSGGLEEIQSQVDLLLAKIKQLQTRGVYALLNEYNNKLEEYKANFTKERLARAEFDKIYNSTASIVDGLHKRYIRLSKNLHEVRRYYSISSQFEAKLEDIKKQIDDITSVKRNLDTYVHSATGPHYSLLLSKTKQLKDKAEECERNFMSFQEYENSLKDDAEKSYNLINTIFFHLFDVKRKVADLVSEPLRDTYNLQIKKCYSNLNQLSDAINSIPIDVDKVNALTSKVVAIYEDLNSRVESDTKYQKACEANFVNANIYRGQFSDVDHQMGLIETAINDGQYQIAYKELITILTKHGSTFVSIDESN